jgi:DnaK suppressor protein
MATYGKEGAMESIKLKLISQRERLLMKSVRNLALVSQDERLSDEYDQAQNEAIERVTTKLNNRDTALLNKVNSALDRFLSGTFGVCEECGETIPFARLVAEPTTKLCIDCQAQEEQSDKFYDGLMQYRYKRVSA